MRRSVALLLILSPLSCGGSPFTEAAPLPSDSSPLSALDAGPLPEASPETSTDAAGDGSKVAFEASRDGGEREAGETSPEASDATPEATPPPRDASPEASEPADSTPDAPADAPPHPIAVVCHLSIGSVGCPGAGIWTVYWGGNSCDASHGPDVSCAAGAACQATNMPGGTLYQGTCE